MRVLQTLALPLGDAAFLSRDRSLSSNIPYGGGSVKVETSYRESWKASPRSDEKKAPRRAFYVTPGPSSVNIA